MSKLILPAFIILIMIMSTIGFMYGDKEEDSYTYNDYKFYKQDSKWILYKDSISIPFDYKVEALSNITLPEFNLRTDKVYLLFNTSEFDINKYSISKLYFVLNNIGIKPLQACISEENCPDIPIKNCEENNKMFYFKIDENNNKVYLSENCIVLSGNVEEINKQVDKINMKLLGII